MSKTSILLLLLLMWVLSFPILGQKTLSHQEGNRITLEDCKDYNDLSKQILLLTGSDREKTEAIYDWIIDNIRYNYKADNSSDFRIQTDPIQIVNTKIAICSEYVILLSDLLSKANIRSEAVTGYCKNCESADGIFAIPTHVWSAVFLDSSWMIMDVTWDAVLFKPKNKKNPYRSKKYFLKSSKEFLIDHLPAMPMWQLSDSTMTLDGFIHSSYNGGYEEYGKSYRKSIEDFSSLSPFFKRLEESKVTYEFNPSSKNANAYGQILLDHASMMIDSMDESDRSSYVENKNLRKSIIQMCRTAEQLVDKMHTWQWEMYAGVVINEIVDTYNNDPKMDWTKENWNALMNEIRRARYILQNIENTYYKGSSLAVCEEIEMAIKDFIDQ